MNKAGRGSSVQLCLIRKKLCEFPNKWPLILLSLLITLTKVRVECQTKVSHSWSIYSEVQVPTRTYF